MDFFGFGTPSELNTSIGNMVKQATQSLLLGPDWAKNMEICDRINSNNEGSDAFKAIYRQLQDSDNKTVSLALTLAESCMQNCKIFVTLINRSFIDEIVSIANGRKGYNNQDEALRLLQVWGRQYERTPLLHDTYMSLKAKGAKFPKIESASGSNSRSTSSDKSKGKAVNNPLEESSVSAAKKLESDLLIVLEKVKLCREMLPQSPGIASDDLLAEVVGFLEACKERLIDLVEVGTQGLLDEATFAMCLKVNDALLRTLEAEKNGTVIAVDDDISSMTKSEGDTDYNASTKPVAAVAPKKRVPVIPAPGMSGIAPPPTQAASSSHDPFFSTTTQPAAPLPIPPSASTDFFTANAFGSSPPPSPYHPAPASVSANGHASTSGHKAPASLDDELSSLFLTPNPQTNTLSTGPATTMSDADFESFLNAPIKSSNK